jgi:hypothetical protein
LWEGIRLPHGGVSCAEHGRFDAAGDAERRRQLDAQAQEFQALLARGGLT